MLLDSYRVVRADEPGEYDDGLDESEFFWKHRERLEPLEAEDPGAFRALLYLGASLFLAGLSWGAVVVVEMIAGKR